MSEINKEDFVKALEQLNKMPIEKKVYRIFETKAYWLKVKPFGIEWEEEQLNSTLDGFIGEQKGIKCYITPTLK
jgi:hypothetical protein